MTHKHYILKPGEQMSKLHRIPVYIYKNHLYFDAKHKIRANFKRDQKVLIYSVYDILGCPEFIIDMSYKNGKIEIEP